jgi:hypothetical protein
MTRKLSLAALATALCAAILPASATAHVTPEEAKLAADRAVAWVQAEQAADGNVGDFGGDWAMIALANAGVNAADLRTAPGAASLQDFYAGTWATSGAGNVSTDQARVLLVGHAGGVRGARLSASQNVLARQLRYFDGRQLGFAGNINDDMFGLMALERNGVPDLAPTLEQEVRDAQTEGGWNYTTNGGPADIDMTAAGIGTLCAAGAGPDDPAVADGLAVVKSAQDDATGGFVSEFFGVNSDTTAWVVDGLRECGIDPQSAAWTTPSGKTPLDFLVDMQNDNGAFAWRPGDDADNLYSTQDSVTALVGEGFGTEPAPRADAGEPTFRPEPEVAAGTVVPLALVIDHGPATEGAERACSLQAPVGGTVADVLAATADALPKGCAADVQIAGEGAGRRLAAVNGVAAGAEREWMVSVDGRPATEQLGETVALGSVVRAELVTLPGAETAAPKPPENAPLPPVTPVESAKPRRARATLGKRDRLRLRAGAVKLAVGCPRGLGAAGCRGVIRVRYKAGKRTRTAGSAPFAVASGARMQVRVKLERSFRRLVAGSRKGRAVRIVAATRDQGTRSTTLTRHSARVRR